MTFEGVEPYVDVVGHIAPFADPAREIVIAYRRLFGHRADGKAVAAVLSGQGVLHAAPIHCERDPHIFGGVGFTRNLASEICEAFVFELCVFGIAFLHIFRKCVHPADHDSRHGAFFLDHFHAVGAAAVSSVVALPEVDIEKILADRQSGGDP